MAMKRGHMNFCKECKDAFELKDNPDYCESCRIILGLKPGDWQDAYPLLPEEEKEFAMMIYGPEEWWRYV